MIEPGGAFIRTHLPAAMVPHLQALDRGRGQDGEQVDVLVAEQAPGAGAVLRVGHRRIVIEPKPEIGLGQLAVVEMRVAAQPLQHRLGDRLEQRLVRQHQPAEARLILRPRPIILGAERRVALLRNIERAPAPHPALDQVGMDVARLLDREIALVDRAVALRAKAHLVGQRRRRRTARARRRASSSYSAGIDAVPGQHREADLLERAGELLRRTAPCPRHRRAGTARSRASRFR